MFDTYCIMDSSGPAVGETTSVVVQRTEGSHQHSFVARWFVLVVEVSIAMGSWLHLGQLYVPLETRGYLPLLGSSRGNRDIVNAGYRAADFAHGSMQTQA